MPFPRGLLCLSVKHIFFSHLQRLAVTSVTAFSHMYVHICSARLAAAAGVGEHAGLKEEGKKDVITGRTPSHET